jgi:arginyl-tRNA synthetase
MEGLEALENNMQQKIKQYIEEILKELELLQVSFEVELPKDISNGDFSTNISLVLSKQIGKNPKEIAEQILNAVQSKNYPEFSNIEIAGPGFINFYLSKEYFEKEISKSISKIESNYSNKNIIVEYIDPNPFKQLHIGHLMAGTIGESISRLYEFGGAKVTRMCYQGDIGPHVAKCIWGMMHREDLFPQDTDSIEDKTRFISDSYVYGATAYKDNPGSEAEIQELNKKLFEKSDPTLEVFYDKGRAWSLEGFELMYKTLGTKFDYYVYESQTAPIGEKIVRDNIATGIFEKSKESEAIIYEGEKDGLHTRVFINSQGLPTYEAKDLGLAIIKCEIANFARSIVITGLEQTEYFKVMLAALSKIKPKEAEKTTHVTHGLMLFEGKKASSRKGAFLAQDLIKEIKDKITDKISDREYSEVEKEDIIEAVSVSAFKYSILKQTPGKNINFDFDKSISFEGDSGPYIQYAYTRALSVLNKAGKINTDAKNLKDTYTIEKLLIRFESVVSRAIADLAPQLVANYLVELAGEFNSWYAQEHILGDENEAYKLLITKKVTEVLEKGLQVLGIKVMGKM